MLTRPESAGGGGELGVKTCMSVWMSASVALREDTGRASIESGTAGRSGCRRLTVEVRGGLAIITSRLLRQARATCLAPAKYALG